MNVSIVRRLARASLLGLALCAPLSLHAQTTPSVAFIPLAFDDTDTTLEILAGTVGDSLAITLQAVGVALRYPEGADRRDPAEACRKNGADYALSGSVTRIEAAYRIEISLFCAGTLQTPTFAREIGQVLDIYEASDDIYLSIASEISRIPVEDVRATVLRRQEAAASGAADAPMLPVPRAGLELEYLFENDKRDTSGKNNKLEGKPRFETDRNGAPNAALKVLKFSSVEYMVEARQPPVDEFTVSLWVKPNPGAYADNGRILDCGDIVGSRGYGLSCMTGGKIVFQYESKKQLVRLETRQKLAGQTWYNVIVTHSRGSTRLYLNGELEASDDSGLPIMGFPESRYVIGMARNKKYAYNGAVDDLRAYRRVLTERDIKALQQ